MFDSQGVYPKAFTFWVGSQTRIEPPWGFDFQHNPMVGFGGLVDCCSAVAGVL